MTPHPCIRGQRGVSLVEALVSLAILAIGVLATMNLQGTMVATSSGAQLRAEAAYYAEQIIGLATADAANAACYAFQSGCGSTVASDMAENWRDEVRAALPGATTTALAPSVTWTSGTGQFTVVLQWRHPGDDVARNLTVTTALR